MMIRVIKMEFYRFSFSAQMITLEKKTSWRSWRLFVLVYDLDCWMSIRLFVFSLFFFLYFILGKTVHCKTVFYLVEKRVNLIVESGFLVRQKCQHILRAKQHKICMYSDERSRARTRTFVSSFRFDQSENWVKCNNGQSILSALCSFICFMMLRLQCDRCPERPSMRIMDNNTAQKRWIKKMTQKTHTHTTEIIIIIIKTHTKSEMKNGTSHSFTWHSR